jgi:DNA-binding NarL/FixJ family response regulator
MTTVVIADDQDMIRVGLRVMLQAHGLAVLAEAADGRAVIGLVRRHRPDVVLMDIRMPVLDGIAATAQIVREDLLTRVLVLTTYDLDDLVYRALQCGAAPG